MKFYSVILSEDAINFLSLHIPDGSCVLHDSKACDEIHEAIANKQFFEEQEKEREQ